MAADESTPRLDPLLGQVLAERYRLTRKIGEGGMGAVYAATHVVLAKEVAVKVLREKYLDRPAVAQRLVQEARLASAIRHDHIIDITDSGRTADGRTFVVMELIAGESLAQLLRREGALPERRALAIVRQVASALQAAHARGIVHRDIKPENILLRDGSDFATVVDFGISKTLREADSLDAGQLTSTGMVLGTPFYMSPEQARGDEEVDHRIDVYAVGVILYECLTGEVPFRGANPLVILQRVAHDQPTAPRKLRPELTISDGAERVAMRAMAKLREDRYPTMEALGADIDRLLAGKPLDVELAPRSGSRVGPFLLVGLLVLIAGVAIALLSSRSEPPAAAAAAPSAPPGAAPSAERAAANTPANANAGPRPTGDPTRGKLPSHPSEKSKHVRAAPVNPIAAPNSLPRGETLPNPYAPKRP